MSVPVFSRDAVLEAVSPQDAYAAVRNAFIAHHRGEWDRVLLHPAGAFRPEAGPAGACVGLERE